MSKIKVFFCNPLVPASKAGPFEKATLVYSTELDLGSQVSLGPTGLPACKKLQIPAALGFLRYSVAKKPN